MPTPAPESLNTVPPAEPPAILLLEQMDAALNNPVLQKVRALERAERSLAPALFDRVMDQVLPVLHEPAAGPYNGSWWDHLNTWSWSLCLQAHLNENVDASDTFGAHVLERLLALGLNDEQRLKDAGPVPTLTLRGVVHQERDAASPDAFLTRLDLVRSLGMVKMAATLEAPVLRRTVQAAQAGDHPVRDRARL